MKEKDKSLFEHNGKTYKLVKQPKEGKSCREFCSLYNLGCEKLCVKAYNELDNPNFGLIEAVFVEADESKNKETGMRENEIDYKKLYEEEHERYEGALERARGHHSVASHYNNTGEIQELEYIFPELKESEDEKIRKEITSFLKEGEPYYCPDTVKRQGWAAWLEKQGEQKPNPYSGTSFEYNGHVWGMCARDGGVEILIDSELKAFVSLDKTEMYPLIINKTEAKFKVGDWIVTPDNEVKQIEKVTFGNYWFTDESIYNIIDVDNKGHLWTIQDAKEGDILADNYSIIIFRKIGNEFWSDVIDYYISYSYSRGIIVQSGKSHYGIVNKITFKPATKEQRDLLFQKMKDDGYEWDAKDKVLVEIKQKPTWSEEDEERYVSCLQRLGTGNLEQPETINTIWLKSLKKRMKK